MAAGFATNGSPPPLSRIRQQLGMLQDAEDLAFPGGLRVQPQDAVGPRLFSGTDAPEDKSGSATPLAEYLDRTPG